MTPTTEAEEVLAPGSRVGAYRIERHIGSGGFGIVYAAAHEAGRGRVALKVLADELARERGAETRFRREAELAARLRHPNSVRVLDHGRDQAGRCYIAFELLEGRSLDALIGTPELGAQQAASIALEVLAALEEAHACGIVHRDLKPSNVFLTSAPERRVKVLDFGIAKSNNPGTVVGLTQGGVVLGTPGYMAPEQIAGTPLGPGADLYALGVVLAEMLMGRPLFAEDVSVMDILRARLRGEPLPFPEVVRASPLFAVIERATHDDRARRYPSAREMADALEAARARLAPQPSDFAPAVSVGLASEFTFAPTTAVASGVPSPPSTVTPAAPCPSAVGAGAGGTLGMPVVAWPSAVAPPAATVPASGPPSALANAAPPAPTLPAGGPLPAPANAVFPAATLPAGAARPPADALARANGGGRPPLTLTLRQPLQPAPPVGRPRVRWPWWLGAITLLTAGGVALFYATRPTRSRPGRVPAPVGTPAVVRQTPHASGPAATISAPADVASAFDGRPQAAPSASVASGDVDAGRDEPVVRRRVCAGLASLTQGQLRQHMAAVGLPTGVRHHSCEGNSVNDRCDGPVGDGFGSYEQRAVLFRVPTEDAARAFEADHASAAAAITFADEAATVLLLEMSTADADRLLGRVCR